jgi:heat shock protein HspQ
VKIGDLVKHKKAGYTGVVIEFGDTGLVAILTWAGVMEFTEPVWKVISECY